MASPAAGEAAAAGDATCVVSAAAPPLAPTGCAHEGPSSPAGESSAAEERPGRAFTSAAITLTLAILGSSVLPVPFAFSRLGVVPGLAIMLTVALANALAGTLLLRAAGSLECHSFEGLAEVVGGRSWRLFAQVSLLALLFGNITGDLCLLADMGSIAAQELFPGGPPAWLVAGGGRVVMTALTVCVVFPLSCLRRMRELEQAGMIGAGFVLILAGIFIHFSVQAGLPAIASGEMPLWKPAVAANLPEAVGVLSFAFYLTPMLLPLLREMPPGRLGVTLTSKAVQAVTVGVAYLTYSVIGIFAAARYGLATEGDILVNDWLPGRWDGGLAAAMTIYLAISAAPMAITLRCQLENLLVGDNARPPRPQQILLTAGCLLGPLLVALPFPTQAEKMFAVTGATAVCAVCYVLPVAIHLRLYLRTSLRRGFGSSGGFLIGGGGFGFGRRAVGRPGKGQGLAGRGATPGSPERWRLRGHTVTFDTRPPIRAPARRLAAAASGPGVGAAGDGVADRQPLLSADHHATAAGLPAYLQWRQLAQQAQQAGLSALQAREAAAAAGAAEGFGPEEEGQEAEADSLGSPSAHGRMGGRRFTDLSLSRWLRGQSFDSFGGYPDSQPATPMSPSKGTRDSVDSFREAVISSGAASSDRLLQAWGAGAAAGSSGVFAGDSMQQEQQGGTAAQQLAAAGGAGGEAWDEEGSIPAAAGQPPWAGFVPSPGAPFGSPADDGGLEAVPEAAAMVPAAGSGLRMPQLERRSANGAGGSGWHAGQQPSQASGGYRYPCIADAGSGTAAVLPLLWHVLVPCTVLLLGVASSLSAFVLALAALH